MDLASSSVPSSFKSNAGLSFPCGASSHPRTAKGVGDVREGCQLVEVAKSHINSVYFLIVSSSVYLSETLGWYYHNLKSVKKEKKRKCSECLDIMLFYMNYVTLHKNSRSKGWLPGSC